MKPSTVNFEQYKVFYYVATLLSFSQAAEKLYISQSAVSQTIHLLEKELHTRLFARTTKQVRLTPAGQVLFHHIEQAYRFIELGERALTDLQNLNRGEIRLGASDTICRYYLIPYLTEYQKKYPNVKITLFNRPSPVCVELLKKGLVDCSIVNLDEAMDNPLFTFTSLTAISDVLIAAPDFGAKLPQPLSLKQLIREPLILLEADSTTRRYIDRFLTKHELTATPIIELGSLDLCIDFVKQGLGMTFASREFFSQELQGGQIREIALATPLPPRQLGLITHRRIPLPAATKKFSEMLLKKPL